LTPKKTTNKKKSSKEVDLTPEELDLKKAKAKLSMWIDGDVLEAVRAETKKAEGVLARETIYE